MAVYWLQQISMNLKELCRMDYYLLFFKIMQMALIQKWYILIKSEEKVTSIKNKAVCVWYLFILFGCCLYIKSVSLCISVGRMSLLLFELYLAVLHEVNDAKFTTACTNIPFEVSKKSFTRSHIFWKTSPCDRITWVKNQIKFYCMLQM